MLYGLSFLFGLTGRLDLTGIAAGLGRLPEQSLRWGGSAALIFILAGLGFKIAAVPFHQWAPDAYEGAPTPVTAFMSVASKAAGFAILARIMLTVFDPANITWTNALAVLSVLTMTLGNLVAIVQKDMKRLFAYSSIANMGYILIGLAAIGTGGLRHHHHHGALDGYDGHRRVRWSGASVVGVVGGASCLHAVAHRFPLYGRLRRQAVRLRGGD